MCLFLFFSSTADLGLSIKWVQSWLTSFLPPEQPEILLSRKEIRHFDHFLNWTTDYRLDLDCRCIIVESEEVNPIFVLLSDSPNKYELLGSTVSSSSLLIQMSSCRALLVDRSLKRPVLLLLAPRFFVPWLIRLTTCRRSCSVLWNKKGKSRPNCQWNPFSQLS